MTEYTQFGEKLDIEPFYGIVEAEKLQIMLGQGCNSLFGQ